MRIVFRNILLLSIWGVSCALQGAAMGMNIDIKQEKLLLNQVGFTPEARKHALWLNPSIDNPKAVGVIDKNTNRVVAYCSVGPLKIDPETRQAGRWVDCSNLTTPGRYALQVGTVTSLPFMVQDDILYRPLVLLLRSYYLQRCGYPLNDPLTGIQHAACHLNDAIIAHGDDKMQSGDFLKVTGGWHDAGDYGKYIATTAVVVGRLLNLYEILPMRFADGTLNIPESGNGFPDLLDEVQIGLEWMLSMQREDGAVYRKVGGKQWPPMVTPEEDRQPRYIYGISSPETAKFAAAMAMAGRIYPGERGERYLHAARRAWKFLASITEVRQRFDWHAGDDSGSGPYRLNEFDDEETLATDLDDRYWAAAELYISTGEEIFHEYMKNHIDDVPYTLFEWKNPASLGMTDYLWQSRQPKDDELERKIISKLIRRADIALGNTQYGLYRLANRRFIWGSNKMAAEEGITALHAYRLTGNKAYLHVAEDQLDYLLGRNPFEQTFVTGLGTRPVKQVHHIFARSANLDIPGLLVGGPNEMAQSGIAPEGLGLLSYVDDRRSYATNEYAIDYNASLAALIAHLIAL